MGTIFKLFAPAIFLLALVCLTGLTAAAKDSQSYPQVRSLLIAEGFQPVKFSHFRDGEWPHCIDGLCQKYPEAFSCRGAGDPCFFAFFRTSDAAHWIVSTSGMGKGLRVKDSRRATKEEVARIKKRQLLFYADMRNQLLREGYKPLALRHGKDEAYCTLKLCERYPEVFACAQYAPCRFIFFRASDKRYKVVEAHRDVSETSTPETDYVLLTEVVEPSYWQLRDIESRLR